MGAAADQDLGDQGLTLRINLATQMPLWADRVDQPAQGLDRRARLLDRLGSTTLQAELSSSPTAWLVRRLRENGAAPRSRGARLQVHARPELYSLRRRALRPGHEGPKVLRNEADGDGGYRETNGHAWHRYLCEKCFEHASLLAVDLRTGAKSFRASVVNRAQAGNAQLTCPQNGIFKFSQWSEQLSPPLQVTP